MGFWEEDHTGRVPFSSHIRSTYSYHVDIPPDQLTELVIVRFIHCKVTLSPFIYIVVCGRKSPRGLMLYVLESRVPTLKICLFSLIYYLFNYLSVSVWIQNFFFILDYKPILLYLLCSSNFVALTIGGPFNYILCPFVYITIF